MSAVIPEEKRRRKDLWRETRGSRAGSRRFIWIGGGDGLDERSPGHSSRIELRRRERQRPINTLGKARADLAAAKAARRRRERNESPRERLEAAKRKRRALA
jgi:hypothetical protein